MTSTFNAENLFLRITCKFFLSLYIQGMHIVRVFIVVVTSTCIYRRSLYVLHYKTCLKFWNLCQNLLMSANRMEGLITAQINPVRAYGRRHQSSFIPFYTPRVSKRVIVTPIRMVMKHPNLMHSVAASVQPLENSEAGCLDNTLPSKGHIQDLSNYSYFLMWPACSFFNP